MGHDITACNTQDEDGDSTAYLRRSAFSEYKHVIYDVLGAQAHNCGVSGCGGDPMPFSISELVAALGAIHKMDPNGEHLRPERTFLAQAIANSDGDQVWIFFG